MILVVGLSPAWQRTLEFREFAPGQVNRAWRVSESASGKGVNVARVAQQLGAPVKLLTVAGGERGRHLVASMRRQRLPASVVRVAAETRICQTAISDGVVTELVEEAGALKKSERAKVLSRFDRELRRARLVVLSGSVPPGCGKDFYARLIRQAKRHKVPVLVDAQGSQLRNAVTAGPLVVKINREELAAVPRLRRRAEWLVMTDGARQVTAFHGGQRFSVRPPRVKAVNPIGSGDAMLAGMAAALLRGVSMSEAIRWGVACGAANAMTTQPGNVRLADVRRLARRC